MLALNATFIIVFLSFIVFMLLMKGVFFDPVAGVLSERDQKLADDRDAIQSSSASADELTANYQLAIADAQRKAQATLQSAREATRQQIGTMQDEARQQAQRDIEAQLAELKTWQADTMKQLVNEKEDLVQLVIQKIRYSQPGALNSPSLAESGAHKDA